MFHRKTFFHLFSLLFAFTYIAFRTEVFHDEYDENHPCTGTQTCYSTLTLNWESFDKDNAPKAFVIDCTVILERILFVAPEPLPVFHSLQSYELVRDKSPPPLISSDFN